MSNVRENKKKSSKAKGDAFESKIFTLFESLLLKEEFPTSGKNSKIYHGKSYFSRDRNATIKVDISIETFFPEAKDYSLLFVIECKDYEKTVPIDDIEEFASKLSQIAGHNVKGIMVTSSNYSKAGLEYAKNKKIGLIRITNDDEIKHEVYRKAHFSGTPVPENVEKIICGEAITTKPCYVVDRFPFDNIVEYFKYLDVIDDRHNSTEKTIPLNIPFLSLEAIEKEVEKLLPIENLSYVQPVDLENLCNSLNSKMGVDFVFDEDISISTSQQILGKISFEPLKIYITAQLEFNSPRWRYTLAHEIAHLVLHAKELSFFYQEGIDVDANLYSDNIISNKLSRRVEYQANLFASSLLMPHAPFIAATWKVFKIANVTKGRLYVDWQPCNQSLFHEVTGRLGYYFNVSKEAVKIRLKALNLLEEAEMQTVKDVINRI